MFKFFPRLLTLLLLSLLLCSQLPAAEGIYIKDTRAETEKTYQSIYKVLEDERFWVVFHTNIGNNLKHFANKWGDDYNRNNLDAIRSILVCNPWWANQVSNMDPVMLAFCPQRIVVIAREGTTSVLYARPTAFAQNSPAKGVLEKIENTIIGAIERGVAQAERNDGKE